MLTLNQIIAQIQALAAAHLQIASSGVGTIAEWQANPDRTYPLLWVFHERTDVTDSAIVHRVRLIAADRVKVGESGEDNIGHEQEVLSDMLSVLLDFIAYFAQQHGQSYIVERSGSLEPFTERGNDRVAGVSYVLNVRQPIDFSKCQIPQTGAVIPPSVDGLTLYDFCDPAVIARLTAQQVACLEAEYGTTCDPVTLDINGTNVGSESSGGGFNINVTLDGTPSGAWDGVDTWAVTSDPCDPATITINGDPYGTVASGATEDISVLSDVGNPVGSLVSGNWEVGNAHLRVNGTTVGNLEPEQTHDHYATINGTQAGSWHNPSQTWRMNVLQGGSPVGSLSGTDWVVPSCANGSAVLKNTVPTTLSTTPVPSGGSVDITAPNATAVLKDTAGVTLSTTAIPSNVSDNITAPDGTVTLNGSAYGSVKSGGSLNVDTQTVTPLPATNLLTSFGFKQSVAGATPNLFRFRKTTGGTEFNVTADANGYPDVTTAQTNLGADSAFLVRVYDLSGNGRDAYWTASTGPQPRLGMATGMSKKQVQAAHIVNQYMQCDCPITAGQTWTLYMAWTPSEMAGAIVLCGGTGSTFKWWINTDTVNRIYLYDGVSQNPVTASYSVNQRAPQILAVQFKTNSLRVYVNGTLVLSHNTWSVLASSMFQIARRVDGGGSIGQFNWNGIAAYTGDYSSTINDTFCNLYQP